MRCLLDTHVLLWALADDASLTPAQRAAIETGQLYVSAASVWEIGIKSALGKLKVPQDIFDVALGAGCRALPITWTHAQAAAALPPHHADPFDRMLIAQSGCEDLVLLSSDRAFRQYSVEVVG